MALTPVIADTAAEAGDVNQYRNHLQGASGATESWHLRTANGVDFIVTLADNAGVQKLSIRDSDGVEVAYIDSNGGASFGALALSTLDIPTSASPSQTAEGRAVWDSDDDVLTIGDGAARKQLGYLGTTVALAAGTAAAGTSVETSRVDHVHPASAPITNYKTATQAFVGSTTFADVSGAGAATFSFAIGASEVWEVEYYIPFVPTVGTGGLKLQLTGPASPTAVEITGTATLQRSDNASNEGPTQTPFAPVQAFSTAFAAANAAVIGTPDVYLTGLQSLVWARARIINGVNAGTVTLQAAQNSAANTTTLGLGCFMRAEKIS